MKRRWFFMAAAALAFGVTLGFSQAASAYEYPQDDGKPITVTAEKVVDDSRPIEPAICKDASTYFNAVVFVKYVDLEGATRGYSSDFRFEVTAANPYTSLTLVLDPMWHSWNNLWNTEEGKTISQGRQGFGPGPVRIGDPQQNCSPPSIGDRSKQEAAYAFRNGQDGTYRLSGLGGLSRYSNGFDFRMIDRPGDVPGNRSGRWLQQTYEARPFDYSDSGGSDASLQINDLNRAFMAIEFKYQVDLGGAAEYSLTPRIEGETDTVIDGETPVVEDLIARVHNSGPDGSEEVQYEVNRFVVRKEDRKEIGNRLHRASTSGVSPQEHITGEHFKADEFQKIEDGHGSREFSNAELHTILEERNDLVDADVAVGDSICYVASILKPAHDSPDDHWLHSEPYCVNVGIRPHVQIRSGDVMVGGNIYAKGTAGDTETYGSWAEYGVFAGGTVSPQFGSGAQYRMGAIIRDSVGYLTYANTPSSPERQMGTFGTIANGTGGLARYFQGMERTSNIRADAEIDLSELTAGKHVLYAAGDVKVRGQLKENTSVILLAGDTHTVLIDGDITTPTEYDSPNDLSQLVIAPRMEGADVSINIAPTVRQVDAWLLVPSGRIDTCNDAASRADRRVAPFRGGDEGSCGGSLFVNGPVAARALLLGRTGGQDSATDGAPQQALSAEIFNLRPDAYVWMSRQMSSANTRYITTHSLDLPPRY